MNAIATANDTDRFADASLYDVTYVGSLSTDTSVRWGYIKTLAARGQIERQVICRNRDGSDAGCITI